MDVLYFLGKSRICQEIVYLLGNHYVPSNIDNYFIILVLWVNRNIVHYRMCHWSITVCSNRMWPFLESAIFSLISTWFAICIIVHSQLSWPTCRLQLWRWIFSSPILALNILASDVELCLLKKATYFIDWHLFFQYVKVAIYL